MGMMLPNDLIWIMDKLGLEWPDIDEDEVRKAADYVRGYRGDMETRSWSAPMVEGQVGDSDEFYADLQALEDGAVDDEGPRLGYPDVDVELLRGVLRPELRR